jgi:hypothetical protein
MADSVLVENASPPSGPDNCENASARSRIERAIGPMCRNRRGDRGRFTGPENLKIF